jgi:hypothetical protein
MKLFHSLLLGRSGLENVTQNGRGRHSPFLAAPVGKLMLTVVVRPPCLVDLLDLRPSPYSSSGVLRRGPLSALPESASAPNGRATDPAQTTP